MSVKGFQVGQTIEKYDYDELLNKPSIPTKTSDLTNDSGFVNLYGGEDIPENADLNNYTTVGVYKTVSNSVTQTIANRPSTVEAFKLIVMAPIGNYTSIAGRYRYLLQIAITLYGDIYTREIDTDGSGNISYRTWRTVQMEPGLPSGGTAGQFLVKQSGTDYDAAWVTVPSAQGVSF